MIILPRTGTKTRTCLRFPAFHIVSIADNLRLISFASPECVPETDAFISYRRHLIVTIDGAEDGIVFTTFQ